MSAMAGDCYSVTPPIATLSNLDMQQCPKTFCNNVQKVLAKNSGAVSIVVAHNHPSLDLTPSKEDLQVAKRIKEAGNLMGIDLSDFLIVGNGYCSFSEEGRW